MVVMVRPSALALTIGPPSADLIAVGLRTGRMRIAVGAGGGRDTGAV
ncbi:hypothetical protein ACFXJ8_41980 [Nonomuraea sp. NPDC059194]